MTVSMAAPVPRGSMGLWKTELRLGRSNVMQCSTRRSMTLVCKVANIGQDEFEEKVLKSEVPVLVDFWAGWCGPCKLVAPVVDWAAENYGEKMKVYKIETDPNPQLVDKYKPYGLPTLILFKDGKEVSGSRTEGAITKDKLKAHLDNFLPPSN